MDETKRNAARTVARKPAALKRLMVRAGVTQVSVANSLGLRRATVCNVLAGRETSARVIEEAERQVKIAMGRREKEIAR